MNISITIQAPELAKAIEALAVAISAAGNISLPKVSEEGIGQQQFPETVTQPAYQQPIAETPVQPAYQPIAATQAVPVTPSYQPPVQPVQIPVTAPPQPQVVPTTAPTYTMEQLAVAATQIVDAGRRNELVQLLSSFGVQALTGLPKEQYGTFATKLREMGARI